MAKKPDKVVRSWVPQRKAFEREKSNNEFYNSWPWRKASKRWRDKNPLCARCESEGRVTKATVTDHKVRIEAGGDKLNESNFQSLCTKCHNSKSSSESRGMG